MVEALPPKVGDIWRDLDPRGGPTFRVITTDTVSRPHRVVVTDLAGKRCRQILLDRFRPHDGYRTGYTLVSRPGPQGGVSP